MSTSEHSNNDLALIIEKLEKQGVQRDVIKTTLLSLLKPEIPENSYTLENIPEKFIDLAKQGPSGGSANIPEKCSLKQIGDYCIISDYKNSHVIVFNNEGIPLYVSEKDRYLRTGDSESYLLEKYNHGVFSRYEDEGGGYRIISLLDGTTLLDAKTHPGEFFHPVKSGHIVSLPMAHGYAGKKTNIKIYNLQGEIVKEGEVDFPNGYHLWRFDGEKIILRKNGGNHEKGDQNIKVTIQ